MSLTFTHCFLYVRDQDEAVRFYTEGVGLEVRTDVTMGDYRWLTVGPKEQPEVEIGLSLIGPPLPPADYEVVGELMTKGSMPSIIFGVNDAQATFDRLRDAGAEVLQEVIDQPYGVIDCAFRDPSGNMIRFSQPKQ